MGNSQKPDNENGSQKPNYFVLVLFLAGVFFLYYKILHKENVNGPTDTSPSATKQGIILSGYTLLKKEINNKRAFNVTVRINEKLPDAELISLAKKIKGDINASSEKGVVFFLLPEMVVNNGAWAAVDFEPDAKVRLIGKSIADERKIRMELDNITDYIGLWLNNDSQGDVVVRIRKDRREGYVFEYISASDPKPSELAKQLIRTTRDGKTIFKDADNPEQFFVLESNGDLTAYDNYGFILTYKRLK